MRRALGAASLEGASVAVTYRGFSTPTCAHIGSSAQVEQRGRVPVHTHLPNGTSRSLISIQ